VDTVCTVVTESLSHIRVVVRCSAEEERKLTYALGLVMFWRDLRMSASVAADRGVTVSTPKAVKRKDENKQKERRNKTVR